MDNPEQKTVQYKETSEFSLPIPVYTDVRGHFRKIFAMSNGTPEPFLDQVHEIFTSFSANKGTIRGMHLQTPPKEITKIVWVERGQVCDVIIDLRPGKNFGNFHQFLLTPTDPRVIIIPKGFAHGFQTLSDDVIMCYATDGPFDKAEDTGIRYDSFGFNWPLKTTNISNRDKSLSRIQEWNVN